MRREMTYQPMGQSVCLTTPEQMDEKLQRRCREVAAKAILKPGESVDPQTGEIHVQQQPQPLGGRPDGVAELVGTAETARLLTWCKPERGATGVRTTCGKYSCSKVTTNGKLSYECWALVPGGSWFRPLAVGLQSFAQAQDVAEKHLKAKP